MVEFPHETEHLSGRIDVRKVAGPLKSLSAGDFADSDLTGASVFDVVDTGGVDEEY
jgi:hypothetical protein